MTTFPTTAPELLTSREVLRLLGFRSRVTLWRHVRSGDFPAPVSTLGRSIAWRRTDVEQWLAARPRVAWAG